MRSSRLARWVVTVAALAAAITVLAQETSPPEQPAAPRAAGSEPEKIEFPDAPDPTAPPSKPPAEKKAPAATNPAATEPAAPAPDSPASSEEEDEEPPPDTGPRTPGVVGPTQQRFEPTEKVRPDFDVSFPVDI